MGKLLVIVSQTCVAVIGVGLKTTLLAVGMIIKDLCKIIKVFLRILRRERMKVYKLYNLDLGKNPSTREFMIGPYQIKLIEDYDNIQKLLSSQMFEKNDVIVNGGRIQIGENERFPAEVGKPLITATATCKDEIDARLSSTKTEGIWDLCLISSYLLGRRVYIEEDERRFQHINHGSNIVLEEEFITTADKAWNNISNFKSEKEMRPLWYYLHMNDTPEAELKLLLGCVILEIIQNIETKNVAVNTSHELDDLIYIILNDIENSQIDQDLKSRLKGTVTKWGESNSSEKFRQFLIQYEIIDDSISGDSKKRVDSINQFRNGIVHSGELRKPTWIKDDTVKTKVVFFYAADFIPSLIQEYLNRKFGIKENWLCGQTFDLLKEYIKDGCWSGNEIEKNI